MLNSSDRRLLAAFRCCARQRSKRLVVIKVFGSLSKFFSSSQNSLNPDWNDFLFSENELNGGDETLKLK